MSIGAALATLAARDPHRPAVTFGERTVTRSELDRRTNQLARVYRDLGVRRGDLVTLALPNGIEFYEASVAIWKLGATPQPLSSALPEREQSELVALADPRLVVGVDPGRYPGRPTLPPAFDGHLGRSPAALPVCISPSWKAPASGGSTGRPKIVRALYPGVTDPDRCRFEGRGMRPGGCQVVAGPLYHNGPFVFSMEGLFVGSHLVVMPRFDASSTLSLIERHRADWIFLVPTMMHRIWRLPEAERLSRDISSLRGVLHLAAPCPPRLKRAWIEWLGPDRLFEAYGASEGVASTVITGREWLAHPGSVGWADPSRFQIRDGTGGLLPAGAVGEVWMRSTGGPAYEYLGAAAERDHSGWETVGDLGWLAPDGYLFLADRRTDLVISGGANIYPAEVEAALEEHAEVVSCAVIGLPDEDLGRRLHAVVQVEAATTADDLVAHLADRLVRYKIPRSFEFVDHPVRDDAGKVRRSSLIPPT